ncbi:MAG: NADH-quinone oxidoreductase subunit [Candidatus Hydrogenedentes bacterium]|nr:NADH-quinone oxidoreductase subunit [Candidatus Hydrogenedentota bacterium]
MNGTVEQSKPRSPLARYFADIWAGIATTALGMKLTIAYFFSPTFTMRYPEVRPIIPPGHRGAHRYTESLCTCCRLCIRVCPVECIEIEALGRGRDVMPLGFSVDYTKCLFCNLCAEACPTNAIELGPRYNLADGSREGCVLHFARPKTETEIEQFKAVLAQKEAERKAKKEAPQKAP